jgi:hypothetical protein
MFSIHCRGVISILPMARHNETAPDMVLGAPRRSMPEAIASVRGEHCPIIFFSPSGA